MSKEITPQADYYPFGMLLPNTNIDPNTGVVLADGEYRYGFQGQENDPEVKGKGNSVNYKYRMHDPRVGRFFAVDPLTAEYPKWSPYQFSGNQVIHTVELEGLEPGKDLDGNLNYSVQDGDGPSQVANEMNTSEVKKQFGLTRDITWEEIVFHNPQYFPEDKFWTSKWNANDLFYTRLNMNVGDKLDLSFAQNSNFNASSSYWESSSNNSGAGSSLIGLGFSKLDKVLKGGSIAMLKSGKINFYVSGWKGNQYATPTQTSNLSKAFKYGGWALAAKGAWDIETQYENHQINQFTRGKEHVINGTGVLGFYGAAFNMTYNGMRWLQYSSNVQISMPYTYTNGNLDWTKTLSKWGGAHHSPEPATLLSE